MPFLKSLTFTALPLPGSNPTLDRRVRVIERLEEQKRLLNDSNYMRSVRTWVKKDSQKIAVDKAQRVMPWWRVAPNGSFVFFIRAGQKAIEFEKGKSAITMPSLDKLPSIIDTLIAAARNGELDEQLALASKSSPVRKRRAT
jgi:hypothetical protein